MPPSSMDKWGHHDTVPEWSIPRSAQRGRPVRTAADGIDPGAYRTDRDFPMSKDELRKGILTGSASAPSFTFSGEKREDVRGTLKGVHFPVNRWINDTAPGQYDLEGQPVAIQKIWSPRYSMPKAARLTQTIGRGPGPGEYNLPSQFGVAANARGKRLEPLWPAAGAGMKRTR